MHAVFELVFYVCFDVFVVCAVSIYVYVYATCMYVCDVHVTCMQCSYEVFVFVKM